MRMKFNTSNPLVCPNCRNKMKIISVIEEEPVESLSLDLEAFRP